MGNRGVYHFQQRQEGEYYNMTKPLVVAAVCREGRRTYCRLLRELVQMQVSPKKL